MNKHNTSDKDKERERNRINQQKCRQRKAAAKGKIVVVLHNGVKHEVPTALLRLPVEDMLAITADAYTQLFDLGSDVVLKRNVGILEEVRPSIQRMRASMLNCTNNAEEESEDEDEDGGAKEEEEDENENADEDEDEDMERSSWRPFLESYTLDLYGELKQLQHEGIYKGPLPKENDFDDLVRDVYEDYGPFDYTRTASEILTDLRGPVYEHYKLKPSTTVVRPLEPYDEDDMIVQVVECDLMADLRELKRVGEVWRVEFLEDAVHFDEEVFMPSLRALTKMSHLPRATELFDKVRAIVMSSEWVVT